MADKVCLMAFHGCPHGLVLNQEQPMSYIKDFQSFMPSFGAKEEITKLGSLKLMPQQCEEPWKLKSGVPEANWFVKTVSEIERPALNVQDVRPDSVLFSCGIAEHFIRREKMLQFLRSGESEVERGGIDITLLYDLMGLHEMGQQPSMPSLIYPSSELNTQKPLLDFVGSLHWSSKVTVQPDGRVLFTGTEAEMKHLLSVVAEFYSLRNTVVWKKQSVLVPHFKSVGCREAGVVIDGTSFNMQATTLAPLKSPEKVKTKAKPKQKSGKKAGKDRDLYKRNYFHACESLLSIMMSRKQNGKVAILSLKRSGPELPDLLTQFSAAIAGTGLAVLFSVLCKVASGRVPFCASKLLNTGVAFALVWLSCGVNKLRDTIVQISKNSKKRALKDEEIMERVDRSVKEIYLRAGTLMAVAVLRLA
ncbi:uncharacterized protein LOC125478031 [Pyrus x bretschneideri]|uniref:uncharacterized protein LOC125478031 n=1 Tax=Pyrus x bretschneideri TaxID=225117 RepID=UPI00202F421B|nr:uncharacterized protein LOC125478031 [Pyrus x bretschneideri]